MDRQKHRLSVLIAVVLLAGGMAFALGRQWISPPQPASEPDSGSALQPGEQPSPNGRPASVEAGNSSAVADASAPTSAAGATAFRGRVIDAVSQQPVQEFEVHLIRVRPDTGTTDLPVSKAFRSASGRFIWTALAEGTWHAAITAPGYQQFNLDKLDLKRSGTREIAMPLRRGYEVRGRVIELSSGAAVVGAWISFRPFGTEDDFWHKPYAQSQEDGSFSLDGIPGGDVILTVQESQHAWRRVAARVNEKTPPQEIALSTGGTIAGTVMTAAGAPVKTLVSLLGPGEFDFVVETSETGQFAFEHLAASRYGLAAGTDAGRVSHEVNLGEDEINANVVLVLGAGRRISGTVNGFRPEHRDRIEVVARHESKRGLSRATVDQRGTYALNGVEPGNVVVSVFGPSVRFEQSVVVPSEADVTLDIEYPSGARLSGVVTQGGKPVRETTVRLQRVGDKSEVLYEATTSEQGRYEVEGLPPGEYFMRAKGDIVRRITVVGDAVQNIEMTSLRLSARVVEDGDAVPIVGAHVYARGTGRETAGVRSNTQTDDFGRFDLTGIEPGEIVLIVYKPGYELHREKIVYSATGANQAITLRRSAGVEVRVKPGARRFPRGFTITQMLPGSAYAVDLWIPVSREGTCHVPNALAGTTFQIGRFSGEPIVMEKWDGQPFELQ